MYSVKRISVRSAAKVTFIVTLVPIVLLAFFAWANTPYFLTPEQYYESRIISLAQTLGVATVIYGVGSVLISMLVVAIYNATVRFHGGIKLELEYQENAPLTKEKN